MVGAWTGWSTHLSTQLLPMQVQSVQLNTAHTLIKQLSQHTRPRSVATGNRHSHATLGIMGNHQKVVLYHNTVDFTATRGQRVKATTV